MLGRYGYRANGEANVENLENVQRWKCPNDEDPGEFVGVPVMGEHKLFHQTYEQTVAKTVLVSGHRWDREHPRVMWEQAVASPVCITCGATAVEDTDWSREDYEAERQAE